MKANMGTADRIVRIIIAITITALYFSHLITGMTGIVLLILAGVFVLTGFICPLYLPFGISTRKNNN